MKKLVVFPVMKDDQGGYDIRILDDSATVEDYHRELSSFIIGSVKERYRAETNDCEGCNICCQERIPLTFVDVLKMKEHLLPQGSINSFLKKYGYVVVEDNLADISLARDLHNKCVFLRKEDQRCSIYDKRPLVCRTYICIPPTPRAKQLRSAIVNAGMDVLINQWLKEGDVYYHEALDPNLNPQDWSNFVWPQETYEKLVIKDIISSKLYTKLIK